MRKIAALVLAATCFAGCATAETAPAARAVADAHSAIMAAISERFQLYATIALLVVVCSLAVAFVLSQKLQEEVSGPIVTASSGVRGSSV